MSRICNSITIRTARNGFWVEEAVPLSPGTIDKPPWVFESFKSLVEWLEDNYSSGDQPEAP